MFSRKWGVSVSPILGMIPHCGIDLGACSSANKNNSARLLKSDTLIPIFIFLPFQSTKDQNRQTNNILFSLWAGHCAVVLLVMFHPCQFGITFRERKLWLENRAAGSWPNRWQSCWSNPGWIPLSEPLLSLETAPWPCFIRSDRNIQRISWFWRDYLLWRPMAVLLLTIKLWFLGTEVLPALSKSDSVSYMPPVTPYLKLSQPNQVRFICFYVVLVCFHLPFLLFLVGFIYLFIFSVWGPYLACAFWVRDHACEAHGPYESGGGHGIRVS